MGSGHAEMVLEITEVVQKDLEVSIFQSLLNRRLKDIYTH